MKKGFRALLSEAEQQIRSITVDELAGRLGEANLTVIDLREVEELIEHGRIPGSVHTPRGELEFYADPESPLHLPVFASGKLLVLHCAGGWRSALAAQTLQEMGVPSVVHLAGGFEQWKAQGQPIEMVKVEEVLSLPK